MSDRNKEVVPGRRAPVLSRALLARTHEMNRDYVELLLAERSLLRHGIATETLPPKVLDALERLPLDARQALAGCPYALYSLGFDDLKFWSSALAEDASDAASSSIESRYGVLSSAPIQTAFCEAAMFLAWHTAESEPIAARFLFGMPDTVVRLLCGAPLSRIRRVAIDYPGLLTPRWPRNPAFWPDLIRFADTMDSRLEAAQLLGNQLIASELDGTLPRAARQRGGLRVRRRKG